MTYLSGGLLLSGVLAAFTRLFAGSLSVILLCVVHGVETLEILSLFSLNFATARINGCQIKMGGPKAETLGGVRHDIRFL